MPIDRFDTNNYRAEEFDLLEYLIPVADKVAPDFARDAEGNFYPADSQAPYIFMRRYNDKTLNVNFSYADYVRRTRHKENIIDMIEGLGIEADKFWYLLLFITDFVVGSTTDALRFKDTPREEIESFVRFVESNCAGFDRFRGFSFDRPMSMTLHVKGRKLEIDNPNTIAMIACMCKETLGDIGPQSILNNVEIERGHSKSSSIKVWLFALLMRYFFEAFPQFGGKKKDKGGTSKSTLLLISRLAYFAGFTANDDYNASDENIKALIRQYRDLRLDTVNRIYGSSF